MQMRVLLLGCVVCTGMYAQTVTRHEVAVGLNLTTDHPYGSIPRLSPSYTEGLLISPAVRYSVNLNRYVALEGDASISGNSIVPNMREGGHQTLLLGGVRAGFHRGRWGLFGVSQVGVVSFSQGAAAGTNTYSRASHFALRQGVAVEYNVSQRNFLRLDAAELLDAQFLKTFQVNGPIATTSLSAVPNHFNTTVSVGHRFGQVLDDVPASGFRKNGGYSVGGFYALSIREHLLLMDTHALYGGGAWVELPAWKFVSFDVVAMNHPKDDRTAAALDGGTTFQAFAGPKVGFRVGGLGLYAKVRPGLVRFSRTNVLQGLDSKGNFIVQNRSRIDFSLDTGAVLQYSPQQGPWRHAVARFEAGSTLDFYRAADVTLAYSSPSTTFHVPGERHSSLLFLSGFGFAW